MATILARLRTHTCAALRVGAATPFLLLATFAHAQDSQFLFDANGNLTAQLDAGTAPPQIIGQPQNQLVPPGETAAFSIVVADPRALTCQWRFNGGDIGGATNDALLLQNVSTNREGEYRVVLTNPSGSVTSAPALLWIDNDGNGLPDSWERFYFGAPGVRATGDADGDGASNLQEFLDGTDPTATNSVRFHLTVARDGGSVVVTPDQPSYAKGDTVTLTAIGSSNQPFHAWLGDIVTRSNPVTLVMTNNKTVDARFTPIGFTWTNLASGDWNGATNWRPSLAPGSNDTVVINSSVTVTLNTPADCLDVTLGAAGAPTLTGSGTLTVRGDFSWTAGTMSGSGRTVLEAGAKLTLDNPSALSLTGRTLENGGTLLSRGNGVIELNSGVVISNRPGGLFEIQSAGTFFSSTQPNRIDNAGTFRKSSPGGTTIPSNVSFNNSGAVEIRTGTLSLSGGGTHSGSFAVPAGTALILSGGTHSADAGSSIAGAGELAVIGGTTANLAGLVNVSGSNTFSGGTASLTGNYVCTNNTLTLSGGTANFNGTGEVSPAVLNLSAGTLGGSNLVTVGSLMTWTAGTMSGGGRTIIQPGATLNLSGFGSATLSSRTLENAGTVLWNGVGGFSLTAAVITNRAGALFDAQNSAQISSFGPNRFDNVGTFRKSGSTGVTTVGPSFNNSGTVDIQAGTLRLAGGGTASGTFEAPATTSVEWIGGTFTLAPGAQLNGAGLYLLNGGNVTADANLAVENLDLVSTLSTLSGTGAVTVATAMNWTAGTMSGGGRTLISPAAMMNLGAASSLSLISRALENAGTIIWTGAASVLLAGGIITNRPGALFQAQNAAGLSSGVGANRFDNAGTFRKSVSAGATSVASGVSFNNFGTVEIQTGTLFCNGGFTNRGAVNLSANTTNRLAVGGSASGTFSAPATALVEWTGGTFTLEPDAQLGGAGLYKLNGGNLAANASLTVGNLDLVSAFSTLSGTGTVTVATAMNWTGGAMSGGGRTILSPGAMMNLGSALALSLNGRTFENAGTVVWTGTAGLVLTSGIITNRPGALFQAQNAAQISFNGSGATNRFDNAGTFRKSVSAGTTTVVSGVSFNNSGTVDIRSGILAANGSYGSSSNAVLNCALGGTTAGTGYGQLQVAGTVFLNGALSVDLVNGFTPALNDAFTVVTAGTRNGTFVNFFYPSNQLVMQVSNTANAVKVLVGGVIGIPERVLVPPQISGSNITLCWGALPNVTYRVEFNSSLDPATWSALPGDVAGADGIACKTDVVTSSNRFYRVRLLP
jgi:hypothetical protein